MANLIYSAITSLDGYISDERGKFDWAKPDEEVHAFVNDIERTVGTYLYGRLMYETMAVWETNPSLAARSELLRDYAEIWQASEKIVYSRTLEEPATAQTRIERDFDPEDVTVGGPELAAHALRAALVDECRLFLAPVIVGGGHRWLPDDLHLELQLRDERRFGSGFVYLAYSTAARAESTD